MTTNYFRPPGRNTARSTALSPWGAGLLVTTWPGPTAYNWNGSALAAVTLPSLTYLTFGFTAAADDGSGNAWLAGYYGGALEIAVSGAAVGYPYPSTAEVFSGLAYVGGHPYFLETNGNVFTVTDGAIAQIAGSFGEQASALSTDGVDLYACLPDSGNLGILTFISPVSGSVTKVATPMSTPAILAASVSGVAIGGWDATVIASGATALYEAPSGVLAFALSTSANKLMLLAGTDPDWQLIQAIAGTGAPVAASWNPGSDQVLVSDTTNGVVAVYNLVDGMLVATPAQSLTVTGAAALSITPDGTQALVCRTTSDLVAILTQSTNVWSVSTTTIEVTNAPADLIMLSDTSAVGSYTPTTGSGGGIFWLTETGLVWAVSAAVTDLGFSVSDLAVDASGNVYVCGTAGSDGHLAAVSTAGIADAISWVGQATDILWNQGQIAVGGAS